MNFHSADRRLIEKVNYTNEWFTQEYVIWNCVSNTCGFTRSLHMFIMSFRSVRIFYDSVIPVTRPDLITRTCILQCMQVFCTKLQKYTCHCNLCYSNYCFLDGCNSMLCFGKPFSECDILNSRITTIPFLIFLYEK